LKDWSPRYDNNSQTAQIGHEEAAEKRWFLAEKLRKAREGVSKIRFVSGHDFSSAEKGRKSKEF
jgi:hypothetical protein